MHRLILASCLAGALVPSAHASAATDENQIVAGWEHCVVNVPTWDRLNIRDEPKSGGKIVTRLGYGECGISVTGDCEADWCPVEIGNQKSQLTRAGDFRSGKGLDVDACLSKDGSDLRHDTGAALAADDQLRGGWHGKSLYRRQ